MIERLDAEIPNIRELNPDVLIVTGDHSTPSKLRSHSWHPVPTVLWSQTCRPDAAAEFGESYCLRGGIGEFQGMYLRPLALADAGRLHQYGACTLSSHFAANCASSQRMEVEIAEW